MDNVSCPMCSPKHVFSHSLVLLSSIHMKQWSGTDKVNETSVRRIEHVFFLLSLVKTSFMIPQHLQKHIVKLSTDEIYQRCYSLMLSSVSGVGGL